MQYSQDSLRDAERILNQLLDRQGAMNIPSTFAFLRLYGEIGHQRAQPVHSWYFCPANTCTVDCTASFWNCCI